MEHLYHRNLQQHTTEIQVLVHFTASNNWRRDLAAFDNIVLSSSAVSRLRWRRDGTISLSRLASNITVYTFCYNNMFLFSHQSCLAFWKIKFVELKCHQCYLYLCLCISSETFHEGKWWFRLRFINDMCLSAWKCVGVGIIVNGSVLGFWLWDLICKFQSTCVLITDLLSWVIYISIFIYQFLII